MPAKGGAGLRTGRGDRNDHPVLEHRGEVSWYLSSTSGVQGTRIGIVGRLEMSLTMQWMNVSLVLFDLFETEMQNYPLL